MDFLKKKCNNANINLNKKDNFKIFTILPVFLHTVKLSVQHVRTRI